MNRISTLHWRHHVAVDLGTATTRIATGAAAFFERPSRIGETRGLVHGVVVDGETVRQILKPFLERAKAFGIVKPAVLACAPSDARPDERQLLTESVMQAGAASLAIIPEPLAAAIGSGLDVSSPYAQMIVDLGEGVTDCAVIRSSRMVANCAIRQGCAQLRASVAGLAQRTGGGACDEFRAEQLMRGCGLTRPAAGETCAVAEALEPVTERIAGTLESFLVDLPHQVGCDIIDSGICLTGGGALIPGMREYLQERLRITVRVAGNPLASVAEGARAILPVMVSLNQM